MEQTVMTLGGMTEEAQTKRRYGKPKGKADHLTHDELKKIASLPDRRTKDGIRDYAILLLFCETPMRRGEICLLKRQDVRDHGERKEITREVLKKRRGNVTLTTTISDHLFAAIKRYMDLDPTKKPGDTLFYTLGTRGPHDSVPITANALHYLVKKYVKLAGIKKRISPHSFRATWVTLRAQDHDPWTLKESGGWASIDSVMPYARRVQERMREAALAFPVGA